MMVSALVYTADKAIELRLITPQKKGSGFPEPFIFQSASHISDLTLIPALEDLIFPVQRVVMFLIKTLSQGSY